MDGQQKSEIRIPKSRKVQIQNQLSSGAFQFAISVGVCFGFAFDGFLVVSGHAEPFGDLRVNSVKHLLGGFSHHSIGTVKADLSSVRSPERQTRVKLSAKSMLLYPNPKANADSQRSAAVEIQSSEIRMRPGRRSFDSDPPIHYIVGIPVKSDLL